MRHSPDGHLPSHQPVSLPFPPPDEASAVGPQEAVPWQTARLWAELSEPRTAAAVCTPARARAEQQAAVELSLLLFWRFIGVRVLGSIRYRA